MEAGHDAAAFSDFSDGMPPPEHHGGGGGAQHDPARRQHRGARARELLRRASVRPDEPPHLSDRGRTAAVSLCRRGAAGVPGRGRGHAQRRRVCRVQPRRQRHPLGDASARRACAAPAGGARHTAAALCRQHARHRRKTAGKRDRLCAGGQPAKR